MKKGGQQAFRLRPLILLAFIMFIAMLTLTLPIAQLEEFVGRLLPRGDNRIELETTAKDLFQTAHFVAYIPFAFIWGALSDHMGRARLLIFSRVADSFGLLAPPIVAGTLCLLAVATTAPLLLRQPNVEVGQPELQP